MHDLAVYVGESEVASLESVGEFFVVDTELVEEGSVEVVNVDFVDFCVVSEFVCFAVGDAGFDSSSGHPQ